MTGKGKIWSRGDSIKPLFSFSFSLSTSSLPLSCVRAYIELQHNLQENINNNNNNNNLLLIRRKYLYEYIQIVTRVALSSFIIIVASNS